MEKIKLFFSTTKLGHAIKSAAITFGTIFIGILALNPLINTFLSNPLPVIDQAKDLIPVIVDAFYRSIGAFILMQIGLYKYSSSKVEANKNAVTPNLLNK